MKNNERELFRKFACLFDIAEEKNQFESFFCWEIKIPNSNKDIDIMIKSNPAKIGPRLFLECFRSDHLPGEYFGENTLVRVTSVWCGFSTVAASRFVIARQTFNETGQWI